MPLHLLMQVTLPSRSQREPDSEPLKLFPALSGFETWGQCSSLCFKNEGKQFTSTLDFWSHRSDLYAFPLHYQCCWVRKCWCMVSSSGPNLAIKDERNQNQILFTLKMMKAPRNLVHECLLLAFFPDFESFARVHVRVVRHIKEDTHRQKTH